MFVCCVLFWHFLTGGSRIKRRLTTNVALTPGPVNVDPPLINIADSQDDVGSPKESADKNYLYQWSWKCILLILFWLYFQEIIASWQHPSRKRNTFWIFDIVTEIVIAESAVWVLRLQLKLQNSIRGIDIETEIEQFYSVILILKPRLWNVNGEIDIETATVEYDFHYRTSNGILKTSIAHACC